MKKLGVTMLAVAFSLPIFATQAPAASDPTPQAQTQPRKGKTARKHVKRNHHKKAAAATQSVQPTATK